MLTAIRNLNHTQTRRASLAFPLTMENVLRLIVVICIAYGLGQYAFDPVDSEIRGRFMGFLLGYVLTATMLVQTQAAPWISILLLFLFGVQDKNRPQNVPNKVRMFGLCLLLVCVTYMSLQIYAGQGAFKDMFLFIFIYGIGFGIMFAQIRDKNWVKTLVWSLFIEACVVFVCYAFSGVTYDKLYGTSGRFAAAGNPIAIGYSLAILVIASALVSADAFSKRQYKIFAVAAFVGVNLFLNAMYVGSRGPMMAFAVSLVVWILFRVKNKIFALAICAILAVTWHVLLPRLTGSAPEVFNRLSGEENDSSNERVITREIVIKSSPTLFGNGVGSFSANNMFMIYVHNSVLEVYYEQGLMGLALFGGLMAFCIIQSFRILWKTDNAYMHMPCLLLIFWFTESLASGTVYSWWQLWGIVFYFCIIPYEPAKRQLDKSPAGRGVHRMLKGTSSNGA